MDHPGDRELSRGDAEPLRDRREPLHPRHGVGQPLGGELVASPVVLGERRVGRVPAGEEARCDRRERQVADPLSGEPRQEIGNIVTAEERELVLHRCHRVNPPAALDQRPVEVRDADVDGQPVGDDLRHRGPGLLDGDPLVGPVHLVEVDPVGAEAAKRRADRGVDLVRPDPRALVVGRDLGEEQHVVAAAGDRAPDQLLGAALAVHLRGVDPGLTRVDRGAHRRDHVVVG